MATCSSCGSGEIEFDLAADARIYLSFWACSACGRRGVSRLIDRKPATEEDAPAPLAGPRSALRPLPPGRALRRPPRQGRSRA